ncbi:FG-GAP-like repeat-containing protein [Pseudoduganella danionis]|nr:FG-GAP-like repeat-containing protein [Pseudoduganella danionis]
MKFNVSSTAVRSTIPYALPLPINQPANSGLYAAMGSSDIRSYTVADLNNDGFLDIFLHPSYFNYGPALSGVALLNDHKGGFVNATAAIMPGVIFQQSNNVFLADFNHDGRTDMFVVDQGLEIGNPNTGFPGGQNHLYLQDGNGVFQDVTATLPGNAAAFNHVSSMADINGDGNLDIIVTRLGGPNFEGCGTFFYLGDGKGQFSFTTAGLPEEIKYLPATQRNSASKSIDFQDAGSNGVADLDGDGRLDLVTGSYIGPDQLTNSYTIRVFKQGSDGQFVQQKWVGGLPTIFSGLTMGVCGINIGDLDGDGRNDIVIHWEGSGIEAVEVLHNDGNLQFSDVTMSWLGSYIVRNGSRQQDGHYEKSYALTELQDVDHNGTLDLVLHTYGSDAEQLSTNSAAGAFAYLNAGNGHMAPMTIATDGKALTNADYTNATQTSEYTLGVPLIFDANNDGKTDIVFVDNFKGLDSSTSPYRPTQYNVTTLLGSDASPAFRAADSGETLYGTSGADLLYGAAGNDVLGGGGGIDTVVYLGNRTDFNVIRNADGSIKVGSTAGGIDTLIDVERIKFGDQTIALDVEGNAGQAYRIYQAAFERKPDLAGLGYWISVMDKGVSLSTVASGFVGSAEFRSIYGPQPTNLEIVLKFYQNVLHREGETAGINFWTGLLDNHTITVADALVGFSESAENKAALIGTINNGFAYTLYP